MRKQILKNYFFILILGITSLNVHAQGIVLEWAKLCGSPGTEFGFSTAIDADGNVYLGGSFSGTVDFDPGPQVNNITGGNSDAFVTKYDAAGNFKWVRYFGGAAGWEGDFARSVKTDAWGNVYVTGECAGDVDFNPNGPGGESSGSFFVDVFVVKYNSDGDFIWAKRMGGAKNDDKGYDLYIDDEANIYVTGEHTDTGDFDPGPNTYNLASGYNNAFEYFASNIFVCKLDSAGNFIWAKSLGSEDGYDIGYGVAVDNEKNVYLSGKFQGDADFDPGSGTATVTSNGSYDMFICKLNAAGDYVWAHGFGNSRGSEQAINIAVDTSGHLYITGDYEGTIDMDPSSATNSITAVRSDVFVAKYSDAGDFIWARSFEGNDYDFAEDITLDSRGNPFVIGFFPRGIDLDPGTGIDNYTSNGDNDIFIAKLDVNGNYKWGKVIGGTGMDVGKGITVDGSGSVYAAGYTQNTVDFDPNAGVFNQTSNGDWDFYVQKLICVDTNSFTLAIEICDDVYTYNNETFTTSGIHSLIATNMAGCDSTTFINLNLKGKVIKPVITVDGFSLGTAMSYTAYQWYKDGVLIPGATSENYEVSENADYTVIVFNANGCTDTSDVYTVTNVGVEDLNFIKSRISIYPNPATDVINISAPVAVQAAITRIDGGVVKLVDNARQISVKELANGMYLIRITDKNGNLLKVEKIVKQ